MSIKRYLLLFLLPAMPAGGALRAQVVETKTVEVTRTFQGLVRDDKRIDIPLKLSDTIARFVPTYDYNLAPRQLPVYSTTSSINPAAVTEPAIAPVPNHGYIRLGLGYPLSPLGDVYLHNRFTERSLVNIYYHHRSFWSDVPLLDGQPAGAAADIPTAITGNNMQNDLGFAVSHQLNRLSLHAAAEYKRRDLLFHGHDADYLSFLSQEYPSYIGAIADDPAFIRDKLKQSYDFINATVGVASHNLREGWSYKADLTFGYTHDHAIEKAPEQLKPEIPVSEYTGGIRGFVAKTFDLAHTVSITFDGMGYNKGNTRRLTDWIAAVTPGYEYCLDGTTFFAGLKIEGVQASHSTPLRDSGKFRLRLFPNLSYSATVTDYLSVYARMGGGTTLNTYGKTVLENPYIIPGLTVENTLTPFDVAIGTRGKMTDLLGYNAFAHYAFIDSLYFYVNSPRDIDAPADHTGYPAPGYLLHNFETVYSKVNRFTLGADIDYTNAAFEASLRGRLYLHTFGKKDTLTAAYHCPAWDLGLHLRYRYEALTFEAGGTLRGKTPYYYQNPDVREIRYLPTAIDLGAQIEYRIGKRLTAFVYGQNLLNAKNRQYYLYYSPGISGGAGITVEL